MDDSHSSGPTEGPLESMRSERALIKESREARRSASPSSTRRRRQRKPEAEDAAPGALSDALIEKLLGDVDLQRALKAEVRRHKAEESLVTAGEASRRKDAEMQARDAQRRAYIASERTAKARRARAKWEEDMSKVQKSREALASQHEQAVVDAAERDRRAEQARLRSISEKEARTAHMSANLKAAHDKSAAWRARKEKADDILRQATLARHAAIDARLQQRATDMSNKSRQNAAETNAETAAHVKGMQDTLDDRNARILAHGQHKADLLAKAAAEKAALIRERRAQGLRKAAEAAARVRRLEDRDEAKKRAIAEHTLEKSRRAEAVMRGKETQRELKKKMVELAVTHRDVLLERLQQQADANGGLPPTAHKSPAKSASAKTLRGGGGRARTPGSGKRSRPAAVNTQASAVPASAASPAPAAPASPAANPNDAAAPNPAEIETLRRAQYDQLMQVLADEQRAEDKRLHALDEARTGKGDLATLEARFSLERRAASQRIVMLTESCRDTVAAALAASASATKLRPKVPDVITPKGARRYH